MTSRENFLEAFRVALRLSPCKGVQKMCGLSRREIFCRLERRNLAEYGHKL